jgi:DNA mismatch endonuclease, patch repair protein
VRNGVEFPEDMDRVSQATRSKIMASVKRYGNKTTELAMARMLRRSGFVGYRKHWPITGKPDFAWPQMRIALFVDGCFWHGCPRCYRLPGDNRPHWKSKVLSNRRRDRRRTRELRSLRWHVLRIWEHALKSPAGRARVLCRLTKALAQRIP